jgi:hypothetical protein
LVCAISVPPAAAAEAQARTPKPTSTQTSLAAAAAAKLATLDTSAAVRFAAAQAASSQADDPGTFLKSPKGLAVLALTVIATGYVFYRRQDKRDEVRSPVR